MPYRRFGGSWSWPARTRTAVLRCRRGDQMSYDAEARRTPIPQRLGSPAIVVGLDGSGTSWDAFAWAAGEALRTAGHLVAVYVMPFSDPAAALGVPYDYAAAQDNQ